MALPQAEIWLAGDIRNAIRAVDRANAWPAELVGSAEAAAYRAGFQAALQAVGLVFGVEVAPASEVKRVPARLRIMGVQRGQEAVVDRSSRQPDDAGRVGRVR